MPECSIVYKGDNDFLYTHKITERGESDVVVVSTLTGFGVFLDGLEYTYCSTESACQAITDAMAAVGAKRVHEPG